MFLYVDFILSLRSISHVEKLLLFLISPSLSSSFSSSSFSLLSSSSFSLLPASLLVCVAVVTRPALPQVLDRLHVWTRSARSDEVLDPSPKNPFARATVRELAATRHLWLVFLAWLGCSLLFFWLRSPMLNSSQPPCCVFCNFLSILQAQMWKPCRAAASGVFTVPFLLAILSPSLRCRVSGLVLKLELRLCWRNGSSETVDWC